MAEVEKDTENIGEEVGIVANPTQPEFLRREPRSFGNELSNVCAPAKQNLTVPQDRPNLAPVKVGFMDQRYVRDSSNPDGFGEKSNSEEFPDILYEPMGLRGFTESPCKTSSIDEFSGDPYKTTSFGEFAESPTSSYKKSSFGEFAETPDAKSSFYEFSESHDKKSNVDEFSEDYFRKSSFGVFAEEPNEKWSFDLSESPGQKSNFDEFSEDPYNTSSFGEFAESPKSSFDEFYGSPGEISSSDEFSEDHHRARSYGEFGEDPFAEFSGDPSTNAGKENSPVTPTKLNGATISSSRSGWNHGGKSKEVSKERNKNFLIDRRNLDLIPKYSSRHCDWISNEKCRNAGTGDERADPNSASNQSDWMNPEASNVVPLNLSHNIKGNSELASQCTTSRSDWMKNEESFDAPLDLSQKSRRASESVSQHFSCQPEWIDRQNSSWKNAMIDGSNIQNHISQSEGMVSHDSSRVTIGKDQSDLRRYDYQDARKSYEMSHADSFSRFRESSWSDRAAFRNSDRNLTISGSTKFCDPAGPDKIIRKANIVAVDGVPCSTSRQTCLHQEERGMSSINETWFSGKEASFVEGPKFFLPKESRLKSPWTTHSKPVSSEEIFPLIDSILENDKRKSVSTVDHGYEGNPLGHNEVREQASSPTTAQVVNKFLERISRESAPSQPICDIPFSPRTADKVSSLPETGFFSDSSAGSMVSEKTSSPRTVNVISEFLGRISQSDSLLETPSDRQAAEQFSSRTAQSVAKSLGGVFQNRSERTPRGFGSLQVSSSQKSSIPISPWAERLTSTSMGNPTKPRTPNLSALFGLSQPPPTLEKQGFTNPNSSSVHAQSQKCFDKVVERALAETEKRYNPPHLRRLAKRARLDQQSEPAVAKLKISKTLKQAELPKAWFQGRNDSSQSAPTCRKTDRPEVAYPYSDNIASDKVLSYTGPLPDISQPPPPLPEAQLHATNVLEDSTSENSLIAPGVSELPPPSAQLSPEVLLQGSDKHVEELHSSQPIVPEESELRLTSHRASQQSPELTNVTVASETTLLYKDPELPPIAQEEPTIPLPVPEVLDLQITNAANQTTVTCNERTLHEETELTFTSRVSYLPSATKEVQFPENAPKITDMPSGTELRGKSEHSEGQERISASSTLQLCKFFPQRKPRLAPSETTRVRGAKKSTSDEPSSQSFTNRVQSKRRFQPPTKNSASVARDPLLD